MSTPADPPKQSVSESDITAHDLPRRQFMRRLGIVVLGGAAACEGSGDRCDRDSGDPVDNDPTDPIDADAGDVCDSD